MTNNRRQVLAMSVVAAASMVDLSIVGVVSDDRVLQGVGERALDIIMTRKLDWARIRSDMYSGNFEHVQDRL